MTIEQLGIIVGILSAIATGCYFVYKEYKKAQFKIRGKLNGSWGNEGDITWSKFETHFIALSLKVDKDDGEIIGTLNSRFLKEDSSTPLLSINGRIAFRSANIQITHVQHGKLLAYGKAKINLKGKLLYWTLIEGIENWFPKKIILHRQRKLVYV